MAIPVGFAQISVEYRHNADPQSWFTVFGVETDLAVNSAQEHVDHVAAVWYAAWQPRLSTAISLVTVEGAFGQDGGDPIIVNTTVASLNGTDGSGMLPQNCAALIKKQTSLGGRAGRGRIFLPGVLHEADVSEVGIINTAMLGLLQSKADQVLEDLSDPDPVSGASTPMVLLHGPSSTTGLTPAPTPVDSLLVDSTISTQRRRLR